MTTPRRRIETFLLMMALIVPASAAQAFECPVKAPPSSKPMPDLAAIIKPYDDPRDDPGLATAIAKLKSEGMMDGAIVDHVIAGYCPTVDRIPNLSDPQKDAIVERFASHLAQAVYAPHRAAVDDIIVDVPVPPDLYAKVKEAADQHKMTQDAFMLEALRKAAGTP